jgi:predicted nucleic acid-binding protein
MARVFVDTNVLFPFSVMDLLLGLTEDAVHEVIWTDALLNEWEEVIVRDHRRSAESAASVTAAIRAFFPESKVERDDYQHLIGEMSGADPDDHEHMAAAVAGGAAAILTRNRKHFPEEPLAERGVRVMDPDDYLCELTDEVPDEVAATVVRLAAEKQRPPKTPDDLLGSLRHAGVPRFSDKVRVLLAEQST